MCNAGVSDTILCVQQLTMFVSDKDIYHQANAAASHVIQTVPHAFTWGTVWLVGLDYILT